MISRDWVARAIVGTGLGTVTSRLYRNKLLILCYHGFSFNDEHLFRSNLFIEMDQFERRLAWLAAQGFVVLSLDDALDRLARGTLGRREIVITIDDGFHSVYALGAPMLEKYGMRATIYVTSYYVVKQNPIFRLAIQYLAWKSERISVDVLGIAPDFAETIHFLGAAAGRELESFYVHAERKHTEAERVTFAREFGRRVGVDYDELTSSRRMSLMSDAELSALSDRDFDIQLHTHRHRLPLDSDGIEREISENRVALQAAARRPLRHLCYPSGIWDPRQWESLEAMNIASATTCVPGFNTRGTHRFALRRFLDENDLPQSEFALEVLGFKDALRQVSAATYCRWKSKFGGADVSKVK